LESQTRANAVLAPQVPPCSPLPQTEIVCAVCTERRQERSGRHTPNGGIEMTLGSGPVLVADGAESSGQLIAEVLSQAGYTARALPSGEALLAAAREEEPAAVVLAVELPGLTGYDILLTGGPGLGYVLRGEAPPPGEGGGLRPPALSARDACERSIDAACVIWAEW
jgi:hypothetical protein